MESANLPVEPRPRLLSANHLLSMLFERMASISGSTLCRCYTAGEWCYTIRIINISQTAPTKIALAGSLVSYFYSFKSFF